jgi:hypothetical protein
MSVQDVLRDVWDVLVPVWQNGGQVVVLGGAGYFGKSALDARGQVASNDRRVDALSRDLRRWIHDRDRELSARQLLIASYARNMDQEGPLVDELVALRAPVPEELKKFPAGDMSRSGAHVTWQVKAREAALHEYRGRATETLDQLDAIRESEGRLHRFVRKRRGLASPDLKLSASDLEILAQWRADVDLGDGLTGPVNDVSRADGETRLRELEPQAANPR